MAMIKGNVAIIMRTKNRSLLLRRAILSVTKQTMKDWILIIVNDGGDKDDVENVVAEFMEGFGERIKVIHNEVNLGMEAASNIGINNSDSEYIVIHDDDDTWYKTFLEECVKELKNSNCKGVITHSKRIIEIIRNDHINTVLIEPYNNNLYNISIFQIASMNLFPPISFVYLRDVYKEIGSYNESLPVLGDWEFNLRFVKKYDINVIPKLLANYHHRPLSKDLNYANTVIGEQQKKHKYYDCYIRNLMLRKDMSENRMGMGFLVNLAFSIEQGFNKSFLVEDKVFDINKPNYLYIEKNLKKIEKKYKNKNIFLYGAGLFLEELTKYLDFSKLNIKGIFDIDPYKVGTWRCGYKVYHPNEINQHEIDILLVTVQKPGIIFDNISKLFKGDIFYLNSL